MFPGRFGVQFVATLLFRNLSFQLSGELVLPPPLRGFLLAVVRVASSSANRVDSCCAASNAAVVERSFALLGDRLGQLYKFPFKLVRARCRRRVKLAEPSRLASGGGVYCFRFLVY
jgi:hypothetical protein